MPCGSRTQPCTEPQLCGSLTFCAAGLNLPISEGKGWRGLLSKSNPLPALPWGIILLTVSQPTCHFGGGKSIKTSLLQ